MLSILLMISGRPDSPDNVQVYQPELAITALAFIAILGIAIITVTLFSKLNKIAKIIICIIAILFTAATIYITNTVFQQLLIA